MSGNAKFRWFLQVSIVIALLVVPFAEAQQSGQPTNSIAIGDQWHCKSGYRKESNSCVSIYDEMGGKPTNSIAIGDQWHCKSGYRKESNSCVSIFK